MTQKYSVFSFQYSVFNIQTLHPARNASETRLDNLNTEH